MTKAITIYFILSPYTMIGWYSQIKNLLSGFLFSGKIFPFTKNTIKTGTRVILSSAPDAIANVLVNANGVKSKPS